MLMFVVQIYLLNMYLLSICLVFSIVLGILDIDFFGKYVEEGRFFGKKKELEIIRNFVIWLLIKYFLRCQFVLDMMLDIGCKLVKIVDCFLFL